MTDGEYEKQYFVKNIEKTLILWEKEVSIIFENVLKKFNDEHRFCRCLF